MRLKIILFCSVAVYFIAVLSHVNSLKNSYILDDFKLIVNNEFLRDSWDIRMLFEKDALPITNGARPVAVVSLLADYKLWGLNPAGYHITNIVLHALNAVLVFILASIIIRGSSVAVPLIAGILFAIHPVQAEVVNVASFRADLLTGLFYLSALILFIVAYERLRILYLPSFICFMIALFSKEIAVTLPFAAGLYVVLYGKENGKKLIAGLASAGYAVIGVFFLANFWSTRYSYDAFRLIYPTLVNIASPISSFTVYINTILLSFCHYTTVLIAPVALSAEYQMVVPKTLFTSQNVFVAVIVCVLGYVFVTKRINNNIKFALALGVTAYMPVSNIIPLANTIADRYMYLPMIGISLAAGLVIAGFKDYRIMRAIPVKWCLLIFIAGFYSLLTIERSTAYSSMESLYSDAVQKAPDNVRVHYNLGIVYMANHNWGKALQEFKETAALNPLFRRDSVWHQSGICCEQLNEIEQAKKYYTKAILYYPKKETLNRFAEILYEEGNIKGAEWLLKKSREL